MINVILHRKNHKSGCNKILQGDVLITDKHENAESFNNYFTTSPVEIANETPSTAIHFRDYIQDWNFTESFFAVYFYK